MHTLQAQAVLDNVQEIFASHLGLQSNSLAWHERLGESPGGTKEQVVLARSLLVNERRFQKVVDSDEAITLICKRYSLI